MGAAQNAFMDLLIAAMMDAAVEKKLTQLKTTIDPDGKGPRHVRLIVVPEEMHMNWPEHSPAGVKPAAEGADGQNRLKKG
jgi:hypothetical protein